MKRTMSNLLRTSKRAFYKQLMKTNKGTQYLYKYKPSVYWSIIGEDIGKSFIETVRKYDGR